MSDGDYVLGTRDDELDRLGLQHRVWRDEMLAGFRAAGFGAGQTILDVGAGPGFATAELADLVGPSGRVVAIERAPNFLDALRARALPNVDIRQQDIAAQDFGAGIADGAWIRWVLCFLADPGAAVARVARALRPSAAAVFHEYIDYAAWRLAPDLPAQRRFIELVMRSWRDSGGEPDAALALPDQIAAAGMAVVSARPMVRLITPDDPWWQWPARFVATNARRLHELGYCSAEEADGFSNMLERLPPGTMMLTPVVAEVIAIKR